jgi:predicted ATPase
MAWLARGGQAARARQAYREFVARLSTDLGLSPGSELQALHDTLGAATPAAFATAPPAAPDDGLVGRSVELRQVAALLAQADCRLVCLIGQGGVGKTRLARRALAELDARFPDGTAFVALEDVSGASEVPLRIARELGLAPAGRRDPLDQVIDHLRARTALLALDNFEHLAPHAAPLEKLLAGCPNLKLIVTSRVRLGIPGEQLLPLDGLPFPDAEDQDRFEAFDAVRLFVKAARRVEPGFVPDTEAASVVDICRQVEGLPLALELAASWTRVLSCEAIAEQLREGTQLLRDAASGRPARHASMEVVFDQSWRLLGAVERDALARLSAFTGGCSIEAAREVAGASLPVLRALMDKSLLRKESERIHLHPLLHHLAALRLADSGAGEETRRAHAAYFNRLLARSRRAVEDGNRDALAAMDAELQNWRAAWRWSAAHGNADALASSVTTLLHYCDHRFRLDEADALLQEALSAGLGPRVEAKVRAALAHVEYRLDRYAEAQADANRALQAADASNDHDARLQSLKVLGSCGLRQARPEDARRYFRQALKIAPESTDPNNAAAMLGNLALVEKSMGNFPEALRLSHRSLVQHRLLNDAADEALCLNNLGDLYMTLGEHDAARTHFQESLALCERHGLVGTRALVLTSITELALEVKDPAAAEHAQRALEAVSAAGNRVLTAWLQTQTAILALRRGDLPAARRDLAGSLQAAVALGRPSLLLGSISVFADVLAAQGEAACARRVFAFIAAHPSIGAPARTAALARLAELPAPAGGDAAWPGIELEDLAMRVAVEGNAAYAPLVAALRETA